MPDSILFWNAVAIEANRVSHSDPDKREQNGPTLSSRALAIVHIAMYDAYAGVVGGTDFPRYFEDKKPDPPAVSKDKARDAVAGAAYTTLVDLFKMQKDFFDAQLSCFDTKGDAYKFGVEVAKKLLGLRKDDMDARDCGYKFSMDRGRHRPDPDNPGQGFHAPYYGAQTKGFAISKRHTLDRPPFKDGKDPKYVQALDDVRAKGIRPDLTATLLDDLFKKRRSPEQTVIGIYWAYDGANRLGTPPRLYNQIIRRVAEHKGNDEGKNARLFAFVNAAMGDAGILAWEQKFCHDFWRPVVGIREHDETLGPKAPHEDKKIEFNEGDPGWLPLGAPSTNSPDVKNFTPNFPAYPSGHATFGAAAFHITRMFYGIDTTGPDNRDAGLFPKSFVSDELNGGNRDNDGTVRPRHARFFPDGLWTMIIENALSRVFLGVHWIFDAFDFKVEGGKLKPDLTNDRIGGVGLGLRIARDIFQHGAMKAPKEAKPEAKPPIHVVASGPMPVIPTQPGTEKGCADDPEKKKAPAADQEKGMVQDVFPQASSEEQTPTQGQTQSVYPSGLSPK